MIYISIYILLGIIVTFLTELYVERVKYLVPEEDRFEFDGITRAINIFLWPIFLHRIIKSYFFN